jgi:predicted phosphodiesterase
MRAAILSDIHGNLHALGEALRLLCDKPVDVVAVLGDYVGYGAYPNQCVDFFRSIVQQGSPSLDAFYFLDMADIEEITRQFKKKRLILISGNHDKAVIDNDFRFMNPAAAQALGWTSQMLSDENKDFLSSLPLTAQDDDICYVHGSPQNPEEWIYIMYTHQAVEAFRCQDKLVCLNGHTHVPVIFSLKDDNLKVQQDEIEIQFADETRYLINVGSVGQPRDHNPMGSLGIIDTDVHTYQLLRFEYDIESASRSILDAGLPAICAERLKYGM